MFYDPLDLDTAQKTARELLGRARPREALALLLPHLRGQVVEAGLLRLAAECHWAAGETREALGLYQAACAVASDAPENWAILAEFAELSGASATARHAQERLGKLVENGYSAGKTAKKTQGKRG